MKKNKGLLIIVLLLIIANGVVGGLLMSRENIFEGIIFNSSNNQSNNTTNEGSQNNEGNNEQNQNNENNNSENNNSNNENNQKNNERTPNDNQRYSDILSIATKNDGNIYAIKYDGTQTKLMDTKDYTQVVYSYSNDKLNILTDKNKPTIIDSKTKRVKEKGEILYSIGYIDLNYYSSPYYYNQKYIHTNSDTGYGLPLSAVGVGNDTYYSFSSVKGVYKYNSNTKSSTKALNLDDFQSVRLFYISEDEIGFSAYGFAGQTPVLGIVNLNNYSIKEISSNANLEYTYNNKIIYKQYVSQTNFDKWKYYEYDISSKNIKAISDSVSGISSLYDSYIIPYNDYYIYAYDTKLFKYQNDTNELLYDFKQSINTMTFVARNKLNISYGEGMDSDGYSGEFNLDTLQFQESNSIDKYNMVVYLK